MGWIKLDDNFFSNKKIVTLTKDAKLLYLASLCYAGANLSDGVIPHGAVRIVAAQADVSSPQKLIRELKSASLWTDHPSGYEIHDYLKHNTSLAEVEAKREAARLRAEKRRKGEQPTNNEKSSQEVRANNSETSQEVRQPETETETETEINSCADAPTDVPTGALRDIKGGRKSKPLPTNGPAQQIVKAYCEATGLEKPVSYSKAVGQAQLLVNAGITPLEIPQIIKWLEGQKWVDGGIDLGLIVSQAEKWRNAKRKPAPVQRFVV